MPAEGWLTLKNIRNRDCEHCSSCEYVGEGTFVCMLSMPPVIVVEDFMPTEDFGNCEKAERRKNRLQKKAGNKNG